MVEPLAILVLKVSGGVGGFALFVYVLFRLVAETRKRGGTGSVGQIVGVTLIALGILVPVPPPPREVATEARQLKRNEDNGDPP